MSTSDSQPLCQLCQKNPGIINTVYFGRQWFNRLTQKQVTGDLGDMRFFYKPGATERTFYLVGRSNVYVCEQCLKDKTSYLKHLGRQARDFLAVLIGGSLFVAAIVVVALLIGASASTISGIVGIGSLIAGVGAIGQLQGRPRMESVYNPLHLQNAQQKSCDIMYGASLPPDLCEMDQNAISLLPAV